MLKVLRMRLGGATACLAALLAGLVFCQLLVEAEAQTPRKPRRKVQLKTAGFSQEPDLPYLPKYSSKYKRFRGGSSGSGVTDGGFYQLRYETAENPDDVLNWYDSALTGMGFKISERAQKRLAAFNPEVNTSVLIMIQTGQPGFDPHYKTAYTIRYVQDPKRKLWKPSDSPPPAQSDAQPPAQSNAQPLPMPPP